MSGISTKVYPRGLPVHPPEELLRWQARLRRWTVLLVVGTVVALALIVEASVLLVRRVQPSPAVPTEPEPVRPQIEMPPSAARLPEKPKPPPPDPVPAVLGDLTWTQLYQSQLNIGLLADAMEHGTYPEGQTRKYLDGVLELIERVDKDLVGLDGERLAPADRKQLDGARDVIARLRTEVSELRAYWRTGEKKHVEAYYQARKDAAAALNGLLAPAN
jgi:hypothetical protein